MDAVERYCWNKFREAVYTSAQIETESLYEEQTFLHRYTVTRHSLNPEWRRWNIDRGYLAMCPNPTDLVAEEVYKMVDELFQPILDLPWETYFDDEEEFSPEMLSRMRATNMTKEEMRRAYDFPFAQTMSEETWRRKGF